jgi:hypothetical protein
MPVANEVRIVLSGALAGGEQWSCSFAIMNGGVTSQANLQVIVDNVATAAASTGSLNSLVAASGANGMTLTRITGYYYVAPGPATFTAFHDVTGVVGATTDKLPNQCAMVVTLLTGLPGRGNRGRMYWPFPTAIITASHASNGNCDTIANAFKTFFQAINGGGGGYSVAVASSTHSAMHAVTAIKVDNVVDTQRRRRDKLAATYSNQQSI